MKRPRLIDERDLRKVLLEQYFPYRGEVSEFIAKCEKAKLERQLEEALAEMTAIAKEGPKTMAESLAKAKRFDMVNKRVDRLHNKLYPPEKA